jgi:hypothetical protein
MFHFGFALGLSGFYTATESSNDRIKHRRDRD